MKRPTYKFSIYLWILLSSLCIKAQDPAYLNFQKNRVLFNPSLVGAQGAQSFQLRAKTQWNTDGGNGYKTASFIYEETMPCSIVDYGFKANFNEEGSGIYRTFEGGFLASIFLPAQIKRHSDHNFRGGLDFTWGRNSIDYSRLIFSDQLHPKYGDIYQTAFQNPNDGRSSVYFNPGVGVSIKSLWNKESNRAIMTNIGGAMYRFYSLKDGEVNQSVSVLGLDNANPIRWSFFAEAEFIPYLYGRTYLTVKPSMVYQKQGAIDYVEAGFRTGVNRTAGLGFYYHASTGTEWPSTKWVSVTLDWLFKVSAEKAIDLNLSYSENIGGLKNLVGPQIEFGISIHLAKSSVCNLMGLEDDVPYNNEYRCPLMAVTPGKRKMYENIWYKN